MSRGALITPALFSHRPPNLREKREKNKKEIFGEGGGAPLPVRWEGRRRERGQG